MISMTAVGIALAILVCFGAWRDSGETLLRIRFRRDRFAFNLAMALVILSMAVNQCLAALRTGDFSRISPIYTGVLGLNAYAFAVQTLGFRITKSGMALGLLSVKWDRIKSFRFDERKQLCLVIEFAVGKKLTKTKIPIDPKGRAEIERTLLQFIPTALGA
ncbi:hypothetical protein HY256_06955 [Candidatus Sumerlaeota bacterium]|nr:hypothetical protein [Candidatus Sumerlaeota bacterium]